MMGAKRDNYELQKKNDIQNRVNRIAKSIRGLSKAFEKISEGAGSFNIDKSNAVNSFAYLTAVLNKEKNKSLSFFDDNRIQGQFDINEPQPVDIPEPTTDDQEIIRTTFAPLEFINRTADELDIDPDGVRIAGQKKANKEIVDDDIDFIDE